MVVHQRVVDGDDALVAVASGWVMLQQVEAALVEVLDIPVGVSEETVEAGLVGSLSELTVDAGNIFAVSDEESGEIFSEVPPLGFIGEEVGEVVENLLDDVWEVNDASHNYLQAVRSPSPALSNSVHRSSASRTEIFILQNFSSLFFLLIYLGFESLPLLAERSIRGVL